MLSKEEQKARLAELKSKAEAKADVHGKAINKALITTGQKVTQVTYTAGIYAKDIVKKSVTDQRKA